MMALITIGYYLLACNTFFHAIDFLIAVSSDYDGSDINSVAFKVWTNFLLTIIFVAMCFIKNLSLVVKINSY